MLRGHGDDGWDVPVLTCAGLTGEGLDEVWAKLVEHQDRMKASGEFDERRRTQQVRWTWQLVRDGLEHGAAAHPRRAAAAPDLEKAVLAGELTPALAARQTRDVPRRPEEARTPSWRGAFAGQNWPIRGHRATQNAERHSRERRAVT